MTGLASVLNFYRFHISESPLVLCFGVFGIGQIRAMPPSAAESLKQRCGVGVAISLGLDEIDYGLLISLLRVEQVKMIRTAGLQLPPVRLSVTLAALAASATDLSASASCSSAFKVSATF
jgi:hypothetical protein